MAKKKDVIEFRFYEIPQKEPVLALLGESWNRVYGHDETRLHFHNLMEIGCCHRGAGTLILSEDHCGYRSSMISVIPANFPHITISDGEEANYWEYLFFDPKSIVCELYPGNPIMQQKVLDAVQKRAVLLAESEYPSLAATVKNIMEEMRAKKMHYAQLVQVLLKALFIELMRMNGQMAEMEFEPVSSANVSPISAALAFIELHYDQNIKVSELSDACSMSETHFRRLFEEYTNMPPMDYVNLTRIQRACELMKKTNDSMDMIASKCGFSTTSTFNRNFKKFLDTSPYQWKINPDNYERKLLSYHISARKGW